METPAPSPTQGKHLPAKVVITALAVIPLALSACTSGTGADENPASQSDLSVAQSPIMNGYNTNKAQALTTMDVLTVSPSPSDGYSPSPFKIDQKLLASDAGWADPSIPNEHCTIPNATLARDGVGIEADEDTCAITDGRWFDPLSGQTVTRDDVEAKPFLPTERAWASGASTWSDYQFSIYRDSPQSVMTISDEAYEERGQRGPAEWRPDDKDLWCGYALRWVSEKNTFGLYLENKAEGDALVEMLNTCPDEGFTDQTT